MTLRVTKPTDSGATTPPSETRPAGNRHWQQGQTFAYCLQNQGSVTDQQVYTVGKNTMP